MTSTDRNITSTLVAAFALSAMIAACAPGDEPEGDMARVTQALTTPSCESSRWVGVLGNAKSCPTTVGAWSGAALFNASSGVVPAALQRYCLYTLDHDPSTTEIGQLTYLVQKGLLADVGPDCPLRSTTAEYGRNGQLGAAAMDGLQSHFVNQTGKVALPPRAVGVAPLTQLAVVDSLRTATKMKELSEALLCGSKGCQAETINYKVSSSIGQLAVTIHEAVTGWEAQKAPRPNLVLALGIGWDRVHGGTTTTDPPAVGAVYAALQVASCKRALLLAPAGDRVDGSTTDALAPLPAAWARRQAPTLVACAQLLATTAPKMPPLPPRPLIYAVGGVQSTGKPLAVSPFSGRPRWAAYGDLAAFPRAKGTNLLAGTAVATVTTAAAATAVWTYRPALEPAAVMETLHTSGDLLPGKVSLCLDGESTLACDKQTARRISICGAVVAACATSAELCPKALPTCPPWNSALPAAPPQFASFTPGVYKPKDPRTSKPCSAALCPHLDLPGRAQSVFPGQPENTPNPGFLILFPNTNLVTVWLEPDGLWEPGQRIERATLIFRLASGEERAIDLHGLENNGNVYLFDCPGVLEALAAMEQGVESALLSLELEGVRSREALLVPLFIMVG